MPKIIPQELLNENIFILRIPKIFRAVKMSVDLSVITTFPVLRQLFDQNLIVNYAVNPVQPIQIPGSPIGTLMIFVDRNSKIYHVFVNYDKHSQQITDPSSKPAFVAAPTSKAYINPAYSNLGLGTPFSNINNSQTLLARGRTAGGRQRISVNGQNKAIAVPGDIIFINTPRGQATYGLVTDVTGIGSDIQYAVDELVNTANPGHAPVFRRTELSLTPISHFMNIGDREVGSEDSHL